MVRSISDSGAAARFPASPPPCLFHITIEASATPPIIAAEAAKIPRRLSRQRNATAAANASTSSAKIPAYRVAISAQEIRPARMAVPEAGSVPARSRSNEIANAIINGMKSASDHVNVKRERNGMASRSKPALHPCLGSARASIHMVAAAQITLKIFEAAKMAIALCGRIAPTAAMPAAYSGGCVEKCAKPPRCCNSIRQ